MNDDIVQAWQNRIVKRSREKIGRFARNKFNPKSHGRVQKERLRAVLDKFGQVGEIYVWESARNNGQWTIFDGHAREELDPEQEWDIAWTSLRDEEVDELVLYYDPLAALARQEADRTAALMADLDVRERALREMLEEQAQAMGFAYGKNGKEASDAPDGSEQDIPEQYMILIECASEMHQTELLERFMEEGLECRALIS